MLEFLPIKIITLDHYRKTISITNRIFLNFLLFLFPFAPIYGQLQIEYTFTTRLNGITLTKNSTLRYNEGKSFFTNSIGRGSVCVDYEGKIGDENLTVKIVNKEMGHRLALDCYSLDSLGNVVFTNFKAKQMIIRELVFDEPYIYSEDNIPIINWILMPETKEIGKYKCFMAKCNFRGRNYVAWYSTALPSNIGPWKFTGLPGTILEIKDENDLIAIVANKIQTLNSMLKLPSFNMNSGPNITYEKYKTIHKDVRIKKLRMHNSGISRDSDIEQNLVKLNLLEIF